MKWNRVRRGTIGSPRSSGMVVGAGLLAAVLLSLGAAAVRAADPELPPAETIIEKSIEASGGRAALEGIRSRKTFGRMEVPTMGIKAAALEYAAMPDRSYVLVESAEMGKIESGSANGVYWEMTAMTGPRVKEGEERAVSERTALNAGLRWRDFYSQAETAGTDTLDGRLCYRVILTPKTGSPETQWYDAENWLMLKQEMTLTTPMGAIPMEFYPSEYREIEGVIMPFRVRQIVMKMQEMLFTTDSVWFNVEIPDSVFAIPAAIQALLEKKEAEARAPVAQ